jgi:glyoxylase-like metal-dependent hydrolase (beta-lactamase superfamily II)
LRLLRGLLVLVLMVLAVLGLGTVWMHTVVEREHAPLPLIGDVLAVEQSSELPVKVSVVETAQQTMPRSSVIDPRLDAKANATFLMTHPAFVFEWADGRLLVLDVGMSHEGAVRFGWPIEQFFGGGPIQPLKSTAETLGEAATRVQGIVFTHLHIDHVDGIGELCGRIGHPVKVFMTAPQLDTWTLMTAEGKSAVANAGCADRTRIGAAALIPLEGFPGVGVIAGGGHTPGSQILVAVVRDAAGTVHRYLFSGDVTNTIDGVHGDVPKPFIYRLVIVPEDDDRLGELRRYLRVLERDHGFAVVVSHDQEHLKSLGIPAWGS